jgi:hypothetical protein
MLDSETTQTTPARLDCRLLTLYRPRSREHDKIDRRIGAIDPASASRLARGPWAIALGERHRERILGRQRACAGFLVVLVELCREVHGFADDRVFELRVVAHGAKDHGPDRSRRIDHDWMETGRVSVRVPAIDFGEGLIKRDVASAA